MKYTTLLFDLDDTLLDFEKAEEKAFFKTLKENNINIIGNMFEKYKIINKALWKNYEMGLIDQADLMIQRYKELFEIYNINNDEEYINECYLKNLMFGNFTINGAKEFLSDIKNQCKVYVVTNGKSSTQRKRIADSEINEFIDDIITSEEAGYRKPYKDFFDCAFAKLNIESKNKTLLIGDSLYADIKGAIDYGIDSCWFNVKNKDRVDGIVPTYEAKNFDELRTILYK